MVLAKYKIPEMVVFIVLLFFFVLEGIYTAPHSAITDCDQGQGNIGSILHLL